MTICFGTLSVKLWKNLIPYIYPSSMSLPSVPFRQSLLERRYKHAITEMSRCCSDVAGHPG